MHFQAASLLAIALSGIAQAASTNVTLDGRTFVNKGLVAFGRIPNDARDSYGETLGGLGSSIALDSVYKKFDGSFAGKIQLNPDRGHNTQVTTDYRARSHAFTFSFSPLATDFNNGTSDENLQLAYESSLIYREGINLGKSYKNFTTGLDPDSVRNATSSLLSSFPALPLRASDNHIPFDLEGMAITRDGLIRFVSDEYGPYIYVTEGPTGHVIGAVAPPNAILPMINGKLNFTAEVNPDTGRQANQGFEGLTLDRNTNTLWALLQSATIQDSNKGSKTTIRYTRILGYDVSNVLKPKLVHEYVVPLPISSKGNVRKASELHIVDSETFLILSRDGSGFGDTDPKSTFKQADLISTKNATDIANTKYDEPANPISPNGVLVSDITPVQYQSFVDLVNKDELAKFGLQSGGAFDKTLIASKLESLALASCQDSKSPNDYFLFVVSDNDFITQNGFQASQVANGSYVVEPYSDPYPGGSADTQAFIYRVTLPINGRAQPGYN